MKKTVLVIAFALASTPFMFAAQTANPPASNSGKTATSSKKHTTKKVNKKKSTTKTGSTGSGSSK